MSKDTSKFRYLDLPVEIRCMIYRCVLREEGDTRLEFNSEDVRVGKEFFPAGYWFYYKSTNGIALPSLFSLATTCRAIYSEAITILYHDCRLDITSVGGSSRCVRALSRFPRTVQLAKIKRLTFSFSLNSKAPELFEQIFELFDWGRYLDELLIVFQHPHASFNGYDDKRWRVIDEEKEIDEDDLDNHMMNVTGDYLVPLWRRLVVPKPILVWSSEHTSYLTSEPDVQIMLQIRGTSISKLH